MELNLDVLAGLNIPEINIDPKDETPIRLGTEDEKNDKVEQQTIGETSSYEDFNKVEKTKEIVSEEGEVVIPEETEVDPEIEESTEVSENQEESIVKGVAEWAKAEELFDYNDEEFVDSLDFIKSKLIEKAETEAQKIAEAKLAEYPEIIHELAKHYKEGVPLDMLIDVESRIIEYSNITEEQIKKDPELQKRLIAENMANNDYTEEEIDKKLEKYEDSGLLEDESLTAHNKLIKHEHKYKAEIIENNKKIQEAQKIEYQGRVKQIESQIDSLEEIIPGVPLTKENKELLKKGYLQPDKNRKTDVMKMIEKDPLAQLKVAQFFLLMGGNVDSLKKQMTTKVAKETKKAVTTYKDSPGIGKLQMSTIQKAISLAKKQRQQI